MSNRLTHFICGIGFCAALLPTAYAAATDLTGAGATFPYPLYARWADEYRLDTNIRLNYQPIGSGGGIKQIKAKTVDFGASDKPLKLEELEENGLLQFPTVMGGVVPVVNIEGIGRGKLKLDGKVLADIYLGNITKWNDPEIAALNDGITLPAEDINVVHRADGSGTTFIFTNYLSKVSVEWKSAVGEDASVAWKTGVGGRGNEGVASYVQHIKNSIGYVEYAYALQNKMTYVQLKNHEGNFVPPDDESFRAAAAGAQWDKAPGFYEILTDEPGKRSWPICGATFILLHKKQDTPEIALQVLKFFNWGYANGDLIAESLGYVPMPVEVVNLIHATWKTQIKDTHGDALWK